MRSNSRGMTQTTFGTRTTQSSANSSILGQQNNTGTSKNSVSDIRRMLARDSRSTQTQANSVGQNSIVTSTLSYSESLRNQRQQTKSTSLALKKLKYQFKNISSRILRSKTSQAAKQAAGQARREVMRLKRQKQSGNYDSDEIDAAITHAKAMERIAKKKAKHLEEEELAKAAGGIQGEQICMEEEVKDPEDEEKDTADEEKLAEEDLPGAEEYHGPEPEEVLLQTADLMADMSDLTSDMMQEMSDSMRDMLNEMGLDELTDSVLSVEKDMDPVDLKMMKIKHRNKEMKELAKADAEYLKAVFNRLEKMKESVVISSGSSAAMSSGTAETSFSADVTGIGIPSAPAPVIDISL